MTHPPATCELCGGTGLYSPSALPCPKGCSAEDIVDRLQFIGAMSLDQDAAKLSYQAAEYITNMQQYISELEQREKDAREKALEEAATLAECAFDDRGNSRSGHHSEMDWSDGYRDATHAAAAAIRALKDEVR